MDKLPKKQKEYFAALRKAISTGDDDMLRDLVRTKNPLAIREDLASALGEHVAENYDDPLNIFKKKEILKEIPVNYTDNLPKGITGKYIKEGGLYLPKGGEETAKSLGVKLHEYGHANDSIDTNQIGDVFDKANLKKAGIEAAEQSFGKHHKTGFFEKEAISKLANNKKLSALLPLLKGAGVGAIGLAAADMGNKVMAGEIGGASLEAADLASDYIPGVGQIKTAIRPTELGAEPTDPVSMKGSVFENDVVDKYVSPDEEAKIRRFNLLRQKLGE
jgi:hypothetical protein